jgi:hypothetical protein
MDNINEEYISVRHYVEKIFEEKQRALDMYITLQQKAVDAAFNSMEERIKKLNELREIATDKSELLPRQEYYANHKALSDKIDAQSKLVYIGLGMMLVLEFVFRFLLK